MAFILSSPYIGAQAITETSTTKQVPLGTRLKGVDPSLGEAEFIYLKGVSSTVVGSVVTFYESDWTTALLAANAIGQVGVAMSINAAATSYGWYQIVGKAIAKCVAAVADNGLVYACATAGSIDDAATAGDRVKRAITASATDTPATGFCYIEIKDPFMDDGSTT
jgi:hypothetical protein